MSQMSKVLKSIRERLTPNRKVRASIITHSDGSVSGAGVVVASSELMRPAPVHSVRSILERNHLIEKTLFIDGTVNYLINWGSMGNELPEDFADWKNYLDTYYYYPQVSTALDLKQSLIWQMGYDLEGSDADIKKLNEWLVKIDADKTIRDDSFWALIFGNAYWHIENGVPVALNPMAIGIKKGEDGKPLSYVYQPTYGKTYTYPADEILHLKHNAKPWDNFGCSPFRKIYPTVKIIMDMEADLPTIVKRRADPPVAVQIGEPFGPGLVSDATYDELEMRLKQRKAGEDIYHDGCLKFDEVYKSGGTGTAQTVEPLIEHFMMNLVAGLSVPEIALGHGGTTTMATAEYQERILEAEIRAYQRTLKRFFENQIFPLAGIERGKLKLNWRPMTPEDKYEESRKLIGEIASGIVSPEYARVKLGYPDNAGDGAVISASLHPVGAPNEPPEPTLPELQKEVLKLEIERKKKARKCKPQL